MIFGHILMPSKKPFKFPCALCGMLLQILEFCALSIQYCGCSHPPIICHRCRSVHPKPPVAPECNWCGQATTYKFESLKRNTFCADRSRICAIERIFRNWGEIREMETYSQSLTRIQDSWTEFCKLLVSDPSITAHKILRMSINVPFFQSQMDFSQVGCHLRVQIRFSYVEMFFSRKIIEKRRTLSFARKMLSKLFWDSISQNMQPDETPIDMLSLFKQSYFCRRKLKFANMFMMMIIRRILTKIAAQ